MAPRGFRLAGRGKRQIKGSIGGGGKKGNLSRKAPDGATVVSNPKGTTPTPTPTPTPVVPDFTTNPLIPWDNNTPIGQLFNQGMVKLPSLNPVTNGLDPRLQMVAGDSTRERMETYNRIARAKRPATNPSDPRILKTGVTGDSMRERMDSYNRIASGRSPLQRPLQLSRMTGTQRGSAVARAGSAALRGRAAASRSTARAAAAPARATAGLSRASAAPAAARATAPAPARPVRPTSVRRTAPTPPARKATTRVVTRGR